MFLVQFFGAGRSQLSEINFTGAGDLTECLSVLMIDLSMRAEIW